MSKNPQESALGATSQVSVGTSATLLSAYRVGRDAVVLVNHGTTDVFVGGSGVTATTGILLAGVKGQTLTLNITGAVYGIVAAATQTVSVGEIY